MQRQNKQTIVIFRNISTVFFVFLEWSSTTFILQILDHGSFGDRWPRPRKTALPGRRMGPARSGCEIHHFTYVKHGYSSIAMSNQPCLRSNIGDFLIFRYILSNSIYFKNFSRWLQGWVTSFLHEGTVADETPRVWSHFFDAYIGPGHLWLWGCGTWTAVDVLEYCKGLILIKRNCWLFLVIHGGFHSHGGTPSHHPF